MEACPAWEVLCYRNIRVPSPCLQIIRSKHFDQLGNARGLVFNEYASPSRAAISTPDLPGLSNICRGVMSLF